MRTFSSIFVILMIMPSVGAGAESLSKGLKRIGHQTDVNLSNLGENVHDNAARLGEQTKTNLDHLGHRIERDAKNFIRWLREDECDREGRKTGPEAKARCEAENKAKESTATPPGAPYQYFASIELDCYRRDYPDDLWGTETIQVWSTVSKADARAQAQQAAQAGNVCAKAFSFDELIDGDGRWVS